MKQILWLCLLPFAAAQTEIAPNRQMAIPVGGDEGVFLFAAQPDGGEVSIVRGAPSRTAPGANQFQILAKSGAGVTKTYTLANAQQGPMAVFRQHVLFTRWARPLPEMWTLNLETGQETPLRLGFYAHQAVASADRVVMVGRTGMGQNDPELLGVLDSSLKLTTQRLDVMPSEALGRAQLSYGGGDRFLLIDRAEAAYWPVQVGAGVQVGARKTLSGAEVEESRGRAKSANTFAARPGPAAEQSAGAGARAIVVLAHLKARSGNDLFFFGPYRATGGYRVGEFDAEGRQVRSYRLTLPGAAPGRDATVLSSTVAMTADTIEVMTLGGTKRSYARP